MYTETYDMKALFDQLGLDSSEAGVEAFVAAHRLPADMPLHKAEFWNPAQSRFLCEEKQRDGGWAVVVDVLAARLQLTGSPA